MSIQQHPLSDGRSLQIERNGRHQYRVEGGEWLPGTTSLLAALDGGGFGAGMGWALKIARENDGDLDAPRRASKQAQDEGTQLHADIEAYIVDGTVAEANPLFVRWLQELGSAESWVAAEQYVIEPSATGYGGTIDAISIELDGTRTAWDWKTKHSESFAKYGSSLTDAAQLAAYVDALDAMGSRWCCSTAKLGYVMRDAPVDGRWVHVVEVNLDDGRALFRASHRIHTVKQDIHDREKEVK
jgi:hypothetical protein